jgi:hypothetical protein
MGFSEGNLKQMRQFYPAWQIIRRCPRIGGASISGYEARKTPNTI